MVSRTRPPARLLRWATALALAGGACGLAATPALAASPASRTATALAGRTTTGGPHRWVTHSTDVHIPNLVLRAGSVAGPTEYSSNWSGYQLSALGTGTVPSTPTPFTSVSGEWVVPTATQETPGQAEDAATWIGIGGGNDVGAQPVGSPTLIQTGTAEQVTAGGQASYYAWYELIPETETEVSMPVSPGDLIDAVIAESASQPGAWTITETDLTSHLSFTESVTYPSTMDTAEWILEAPTEVGTSGTGEATLPNVGTVQFGGATVNGALAPLKQAFVLDMEPSSAVVADPSVPDSTGAGFNDCSYPPDNAAGDPIASCPAPTTPLTGPSAGAVPEAPYTPLLVAVGLVAATAGALLPRLRRSRAARQARG